MFENVCGKSNTHLSGLFTKSNRKKLINYKNNGTENWKRNNSHDIQEDFIVNNTIK